MKIKSAEGEESKHIEEKNGQWTGGNNREKKASVKKKGTELWGGSAPCNDKSLS